MPSVQIKIPDQLLVPFGGPKWSIEGINVVGVSTDGTFLQCDTPLAYIDKSKSQALRLTHFPDVVPGDWDEIEKDADDAVALIHSYLREKCKLATDAERAFLDLYFGYCKELITPSEFRKMSAKPLVPPYDDPDWIFSALLPLPQAHLYAANPFDKTYSFAPSRMMKVDFAFWTGNRLIAIEIDGGSHIGSDAHIEKDRLLQRSGVHVIHILNSEIAKHGDKVIRRLLPNEITYFFMQPAGLSRPRNPFSGLPF
jgi:hypothetical protein